VGKRLLCVLLVKVVWSREKWIQLGVERRESLK
jgi:hypothetical protein